MLKQSKYQEALGNAHLGWQLIKAKENYPCAYLNITLIRRRTKDLMDVAQGAKRAFSRGICIIGIVFAACQ